MEKIKDLQKIIDKSSNIVFFGGAGVSTESGIPDFRSQNGLYNQEWQYPPETIISKSFFLSHTKEFYRFYQKKMIKLDAKPNITHKVLYELEKKGKLKSIVTQNIDGLHQIAGSKRVWELHGSIMRNYCQNCHAFYSAEDTLSMSKKEGLPLCTKKTNKGKVCNGIIKPDVVLYEEGLDTNTLSNAINDIENADTLIIGGTSLIVYPAASLIDYFKGKNLILINKTQTAKDSKANLVIYDSLGSVFSKIAIN